MKTSKSLSFGDLSFRWIDANGPSLGLVVSKKYGNAVQRNLFKRRCRSIFRIVLVNGGSELSLIVRPKSKNISYVSIINSFSAAYEKLSN